MPRIILTDQFDMRTLELLPGENYKVDLHRTRDGAERLSNLFSGLDPISDRVHIKISSADIVRQVFRIYNESMEFFRRRCREDRVYFLPPEDRSDICPGDVVLVLSVDQKLKGEWLDVHELKLSGV